MCVLILSFQANWMCTLTQLEVTKYANLFIKDKISAKRLFILTGMTC